MRANPREAMPKDREDAPDVTPGGTSDGTVRPGSTGRPYVLFEPRLRAYLAGLRASGKALPTCLAHPDRPYKKEIRRAAGYRATLGRNSGRREAEILREAVAELGLERLRPVAAKGPVSLGELRDVVVAEREAELAGSPARGREVANLRWSLNTARKSRAEGWSAAARVALETTLSAAAPAAGKLRQGLVYALDRLSVMEACDDLPEAFDDALVFAMRRQGLTIAALTREVGLGPKKDLLMRWAKGHTSPGPAHAGLLATLEARLQLEPGALAARVRTRQRSPGQIPLAYWPEALRDDRRRRAALRPFLPAGLAAMTEAERADAFAHALASLPKRAPNPQARMQADRYFLKDFGPQAGPQWRDICALRTSRIAPLRMRRPARPWAAGSIDIHRSRFAALFGWLTARRGDGLCVPVADLTFAMLVFPAVTHGFLSWRAERNLDLADRAYFTKVDLTTLECAAAHVDPELGWIGQSPGLAATLRPIPGLVEASEIDAVRADWHGACRDAQELYRNQKREMRRFVTEGRDQQARVRPILEMPDPFVALRMIAEGVRRDWLEAEPGTRHRATGVRDVVMNGILSQTALRTGTMLKLRWSDDARGHLRREADGWWLRIPRQLFKNGNAGWFVRPGGGFRDYERRLIDAHGLYGALDEYTRHGRDLLLAGQAGDHLVVGGKRGTFTGVALYFAVERIAARHLGPAGVGGGIPGMTYGFGTHGYRHILATATLKRTSDFELAADAIHDAVQTVRDHYAHWMPEDRRSALDSVLAQGLAAG